MGAEAAKVAAVAVVLDRGPDTAYWLTGVSWLSLTCPSTGYENTAPAEQPEQTVVREVAGIGQPRVPPAALAVNLPPDTAGGGLKSGRTSSGPAHSVLTKNTVS